VNYPSLLAHVAETKKGLSKKYGMVLYACEIERRTLVSLMIQIGVSLRHVASVLCYALRYAALAVGLHIELHGRDRGLCGCTVSFSWLGD